MFIIVEILSCVNQMVRKNSVLDNSVLISGIVLHTWSTSVPIFKYIWN